MKSRYSTHVLAKTKSLSSTPFSQEPTPSPCPSSHAITVALFFEPEAALFSGLPPVPPHPLPQLWFAEECMLPLARTYCRTSLRSLLFSTIISRRNCRRMLCSVTKLTTRRRGT